ncbi:MAG: hypothetical protein SGI84_05125 [Gemmatimonadota bacterium]|nr:hypothetical protein [Gemmatimonadota bacterium]
MGAVVQVTETESLPGIVWTWEPETDILAGALRPPPSGSAASLELSGHDGSVVVLDLAGGGLAGLDVVVWPEVTTVPGLLAPVALRRGTIAVRLDAGASLLELDVALAARVSSDEAIIHVRVGAPRPATLVQVADHLAAEVDSAGGLAGFWLTAVPPLTSLEDPA